MGRPISSVDGQIAAIAQVHALALVTRNVRDFDACGVPVVNPFGERFKRAALDQADQWSIDSTSESAYDDT